MLWRQSAPALPRKRGSGFLDVPIDDGHNDRGVLLGENPNPLPDIGRTGGGGHDRLRDRVAAPSDSGGAFGIAFSVDSGAPRNCRQRSKDAPLPPTGGRIGPADVRPA